MALQVARAAALAVLRDAIAQLRDERRHLAVVGREVGAVSSNAGGESLHSPRPLPYSTCGQLLAAARRSLNQTSRSEEHTSELQSLRQLVCRLLLEKKKKNREMN